MNRVELEGVLAHELSHIKNYDILVSTLAVTMVGRRSPSCPTSRSASCGGDGGRRNGNDRDGNGSRCHPRCLGLRAADPVARSSPRLMQFAVSRRRESLADVSGVEMTRYPPGLISALEKLRDDQTVVALGIAGHRAPLDRAAHRPHRGRGPAVTDQPPVRHPPAARRAHRRAPGALITVRAHSWRPLLVSLAAVGGLALACVQQRCGRSVDTAAAALDHDSSTTTTMPRSDDHDSARRARAAHRAAARAPARSASRPALAVKIDNVDPTIARPQAGINQADVVFEEIVEGGITRLVASSSPS